MLSFPNQKLYHIKKKIEEGDIFIMLKWEDYIAAANELSPSALNLYMYLAKNQDNFDFWFSSKDYCNTFHVVDKTFRNARNELLNKGYLKNGENNNVYFDSKGSYKVTKEDLQTRLCDVYSELKLKDEKLAQDFWNQVAEEKLTDIKNDNVYMTVCRNLISFGEDLLKTISSAEIANLL